MTAGKKVTFAGQSASSQQKITDEMRAQWKESLLVLIQEPDAVILTKNSYDQLALVVAIFIKYDFPAQWPQLNTWLLKFFEQLHNGLQTLQSSDVPRLERFLGFYLEVLKEQNKKKLSSSKGHFVKVAKDHLKAVAKVWSFFNSQQEEQILQATNA